MSRFVERVLEEVNFGDKDIKRGFNEEIVIFFDKYIICYKLDSLSEMEDFVNL